MLVHHRLQNRRRREFTTTSYSSDQRVEKKKPMKFIWSVSFHSNYGRTSSWYYFQIDEDLLVWHLQYMLKAGWAQGIEHLTEICQWQKAIQCARAEVFRFHRRSERNEIGSLEGIVCHRRKTSSISCSISIDDVDERLGCRNWPGSGKHRSNGKNPPSNPTTFFEWNTFDVLHVEIISKPTNNTLLSRVKVVQSIRQQMFFFFFKKVFQRSSTLIKKESNGASMPQRHDSLFPLALKSSL